MHHEPHVPAPPSPFRPSYRHLPAAALEAQEHLRTLRDWVRYAASRMQAAGLSFGHGTANAHDEAIWLVCWCLYLSPEHYEALADAQVLPEERRRVRHLIDARCERGQPLAYLIGEAWLMGYRFRADPRALVPRSLLAEALVNQAFEPWLAEQHEDDPDKQAAHAMLDAMLTELGDQAAWMPDEENTPVSGPRRVLDLCTGGGSLAIIAAHCFPEAEIIASDLSLDALALATDNLNDYGLADRITLYQGDLFAPLPDTRFDLILCNPPYVNAQSMAALPAEYRAEPEDALGSGTDGMDLIARLLVDAPDYLSDQGILVIEIGHEMPHFQARFPGLAATAIPVAQGDDRIVLIRAADLNAWRDATLPL
ncbi:MAG: HemK family protein methyltransferase [Lautropia sp.]|nr:HemK family protein methyltransferase [Lautropia sp.]